MMDRHARRAGTLGTFAVVKDAEHLVPVMVACMRSFSDQVIVCVNDATVDGTRAVLTDLAVDWFEYPVDAKCGAGEAAYNVCVNRLATDWVFSLHDDELVGPQFIEALPSMLQSLSAWKFPHYNIYPALGARLFSEPYWPDGQLRLIPRTMWLSSGGWPEQMHAMPAWPSQWAEVGIFHYKFVVKTHAQRLQRLNEWIAWDRMAGEPHYRAFSMIEEQSNTHRVYGRILEKAPEWEALYAVRE